METMNGMNYFNQESFEQLCEMIESGKHVKVYIDCIGFSRAHYEGLHYRDAVEEKYGDKVKITKHESNYYDEWSFKLEC